MENLRLLILSGIILQIKGNICIWNHSKKIDRLSLFTLLN